jgi:hypothetical protein
MEAQLMGPDFWISWGGNFDLVVFTALEMEPGGLGLAEHMSSHRAASSALGIFFSLILVPDIGC